MSPAAEIVADRTVLRRLLAEQHPDLAAEPLTVAGEGWDNVVIRVGAGLVARLPRRQLGADLVERELRWAPEAAAGSPLPTSVPVREGRPGAGYPWPWTICRWLPGRTAVEEPPCDLAGTARLLGDFVSHLHRPAPPQAPYNPYRGVPLATRDDVFRQWAAAAAPEVAAPARRIWGEALAAPAWPGPPVWLHGDLHPANLIVQDGVLSGVIDFGDVTAGDPACDLAVAWMLLDRPARTRFLHGRPRDLVLRARGWAVLHGLGFAAAADDPRIRSVGTRTLDEVLAPPISGHGPCPGSERIGG